MVSQKHLGNQWIGTRSASSYNQLNSKHFRAYSRIAFFLYKKTIREWISTTSLKKKPSELGKSKVFWKKTFAVDIELKFLFYKAKTSFLKLKSCSFRKKVVRNFLETPRVVICQVVADHQYHSSRPSSKAAKISHNQKVIAAAKMMCIVVFRCRKVKKTLCETHTYPIWCLYSLASHFVSNPAIPVFNSFLTLKVPSLTFRKNPRDMSAQLQIGTHWYADALVLCNTQTVLALFSVGTLMVLFAA